MTVLLGKATTIMELDLLREERGWNPICSLLLREFGKRSKSMRIFSQYIQGILNIMDFSTSEVATMHIKTLASKIYTYPKC